MAFQLKQFIQLRPYLYHLTSRSNLPLIRSNQTLCSAGVLLTRAGLSGVIQTKRLEHLSIVVEGDRFHIRDQSPLHAGNTMLTDGWTFENLVESLNERVYFWPGTALTPSKYGVRHHGRYTDEDPVIIRVQTERIIELNSDNKPEFCKFNSGSPRCSGGRKSPRGPQTFVRAENAPFSMGRVVEVTFLKSVRLPPAFETSDQPTGPWS